MIIDDLNEIEELIESGNLELAKSKILAELQVDPDNINFLNNLAVTEILSSEFENAKKTIDRIIELNPTDDVAINNLYYLYKNTKSNFQFSEIGNFGDYLNFIALNKENFNRIKNIERSLNENSTRFNIKGICTNCSQMVDFEVNKVLTESVNWRETLVCPKCHFTNRLRATLQLLKSGRFDGFRDKIYITEQVTPFFQQVKSIYPKTIGSEYLGDYIPLGNSNSTGVRNEDVTNLTFSDDSLQTIICLEVLEHVPDHSTAISEFFRTLSIGGKLILTAPFVQNSKGNIVKAFQTEKNEIHIIGEPEYHGDPVNPESGALCYYHFGWELLDLMRQIGFSKVNNLFYWSREYAYLGEFNNIILAEK